MLNNFAYYMYLTTFSHAYILANTTIACKYYRISFLDFPYHQFIHIFKMS